MPQRPNSWKWCIQSYNTLCYTGLKHPKSQRTYLAFWRSCIGKGNYRTQLNGCRDYIGCTLRSGLHEIPTMIRTFPHGFEKNHAWKWTSDSFPRMLTDVLFLLNCQKTSCLHDYSPIHVDRSLSISHLGDNSVSYFS